MPALTRHHAPKLLSKVGGIAHATQDDHYDALMTPPASNSTRSSTSGGKITLEDEEDIMREPDSSGDEDGRAPPTSSKTEAKTVLRMPISQVDGNRDDLPKGNLRQPKARISSPANSGSKRSADSLHSSSDAEGPIFSSQASRKASPIKKRKTAHDPGYDPPALFGNIHARVKKYGIKSNATAERKAKLELARAAPVVVSPKKKGLVKPRNAGNADQTTGCEASRPHLRAAKQRDDVDFASYETSSGLSDADGTPPPEEIQALGLPAPKPHAPLQIECSICDRLTSMLLKQEFEDKYTNGQHMSYAWQSRFCRYHKQHEAQQLWDARGYPVIDWNRLLARVQQPRHHGRVRQVMNGEVTSHYRARFEASVKSGETLRSVLQISSEDEWKKRVSVGYYGPRGEKVITDHIVTTLNFELRLLATKDHFIAAAGEGGGVSGFVQAVLVPEMVASLVAEDLGVPIDSEEVHSVLTESKEVGELLNPEIEERVIVLDDDDDDDDDGDAD